MSQIASGESSKGRWRLNARWIASTRGLEHSVGTETTCLPSTGLIKTLRASFSCIAAKKSDVAKTLVEGVTLSTKKGTGPRPALRNDRVMRDIFHGIIYQPRVD